MSGGKRELCVAALQLPLGGGLAENLDALEPLIAEAAARGARLVLPPELFEGPYFCKRQTPEPFATAASVGEHKAVAAMCRLAKAHRIFIPASFFERDGPHYYNSLAMIDDTGTVMGVYRKSHIPDGPGYQEKFYFRPGNTGFRVWNTAVGRIGVGICWDQWYPETARALMLMGAEILLFPTAIGDEPEAEALDTSRLWRRAMVGHAVSNVVPVVAANRIGIEDGQGFYGHSFIADQRGDLVAAFGAEESGVLVASFDLVQIAQHRATFGFFRDRRPELYAHLGEDV